jgi:hypothetical protein
MSPSQKEIVELLRAQLARAERGETSAFVISCVGPDSPTVSTAYYFPTAQGPGELRRALANALDKLGERKCGQCGSVYHGLICHTCIRTTPEGS